MADFNSYTVSSQTSSMIRTYSVNPDYYWLTTTSTTTTTEDPTTTSDWWWKYTTTSRVFAGTPDILSAFEFLYADSAAQALDKARTEIILEMSEVKFWNWFFFSLRKKGKPHFRSITNEHLTSIHPDFGYITRCIIFLYSCFFSKSTHLFTNLIFKKAIPFFVMIKLKPTQSNSSSFYSPRWGGRNMNRLLQTKVANNRPSRQKTDNDPN